MNEIKVFSFFSGSGFLDLGFELNGFDIVLVNEVSPAFQEAYKYSREKMGIKPPKYGYSGDINAFLGDKEGILKEQIDQERKNGNLVGFIGGPPCPDFSVAGKQRGRDGENGKLSLSYINLILEQKPDFFLFENVKGLWRTEKHRKYYDELKRMLLEGGYSLTDRLTNALEYGAPQDRDRILLFGIRKDLLGERQIENFPWEKYVKYKLDDIKKLPWPGAEPFKPGQETECPDGIPKELTAQFWFDRNDVEHHANGKDYFQPRQGLARIQSVMEGDDSKKSYKRIHRWRYSPTVCYGNNEVHLHPYKERRMSVAETMALQSLPKAFELPADMSLTNKFKTIGNGVPYLLAQGIAKTIYDYLKEGDLNAKNDSIQHN